MKCPKCQYISFDSAERCRNCGFEFALATPDVDLPLRPGPPAEGPSRDFTYRGPSAPQAPAQGGGARGARTPGGLDLPLFSEPVPGVDDTPLIKVPATPRAPLAVRRSATDTPRHTPPAPPEGVRRPPVAPGPEQVLDFGADAAARQPARETASRGGNAVSAEPGVQRGVPMTAGEAAPAARRLAAGLVDLGIMAAIDGLVVYFTLRLTGLGARQITHLPLLPLLGFFVLLNGGYLAGFTAASGQTMGKMLAGLRVVSESGRPVPLGHAFVRAAFWVLSVLPLGLGCLPALSGTGRTLHDRLASTRVVRA
jgi:uncharacterized RDD family membrane protein YckC